MQKNLILTKEQRKKLNASGIAEKHNVSPAYVSQVLTGDKEANSDTAKKIIEDAMRILEILEENSPTKQ